jgi:ketosteroid isomerase-like protein
MSLNGRGAVSHHRESLPLETPEQALLSFADALNGGQLDVASACFARDGYILTPNATAIRGREGIRSILAQLIAGRTRIQVQADGMLTVGAVALSSAGWTLRSVGPEECPLEQVCAPTVVLHRIEDAWKLAIVAPWRQSQTRVAA